MLKILQIFKTNDKSTEICIWFNYYEFESPNSNKNTLDDIYLTPLMILR
jgi:hypothetical protein